MRVLLVSHRFPPDDVGGVERYTQDLAAELVRCGDSVAVVARRSERGRKDLRLLRERLPDGTSVYRLVAGIVSFEHFLDDHRGLEQMFTTAVVESSAEIVHINHVMGLSPRFIHIAHQLGAAVVVSLHDFYFACPKVHLQKPGGDLCEGPDGGHECAKACFMAGSEHGAARWGLRSRYFRRALEMAERIVCYSEYVGIYFRNLLGPKVHIDILPNGVPPQLKHQDGAGAESGRRAGLNLAYCGTVAPHKGPHVILDALRIAKLESVNLRVIGHFPEIEYARRLRTQAAAIPGLTMRMYGTYERRELPFLLQDLDCVVVPSLVPEAGPIVPREALAQGVPIVVARLGALTELVREGENGFTFDSSRPHELAAVLSRIASDENLRDRLRTGARKSPIIRVAEHTQLVRSVYDNAIRDFGSLRVAESRDAEEFNFLHGALLDLGCDLSGARGAPLNLRAGAL